MNFLEIKDTIIPFDNIALVRHEKGQTILSLRYPVNYSNGEKLNFLLDDSNKSAYCEIKKGLRQG